MPGCRCAGGCVCALTDSDTIRVTGSGSSGSPFEFRTLPKITVSDTEPVGPELYDLWVDIS